MITEVIPPRQTWDICVVGSGPVGLAFALECEKLGREVLILESGDFKPVLTSANDSDAEIADPARHAPMSVAVSRAIGGTSWLWGGRCVPYDDVDFSERPFLPESAWPIRHQDISSFYPAACAHLLCGNAQFQAEPQSIPTLAPHATASLLERWSTESRLALVHTDAIRNSKLITLCRNQTVVELQFSTPSSVCGVAAVSRERRTQIQARRVILAAGGVETTRLLLATQRKHPALFGGVEGPLGRFYMGHISGKIASLQLINPSTIGEFDFFKDETGAYVRRRFALSAKTQIENELLNTVFWPDNPAFYDPQHRSGVLSAVFLALATPSIGRRILPEAIRLAHTGPKPYPIAAHLRNLLLDGPSGALDMANIIRYRLIAKPRKPGFLIQNPSGNYALHYHAEQEPNPDSRITLLDVHDRFGLPKARIDLRYTERDVHSVMNSHKILDGCIRKSKIGQLTFSYPAFELAARIDQQASDGFHQAGTTRMGPDPRTSVVDCNSRVHGLENLYIASSSVFPSSGQANSTFLAAALAVRLAHHLAQSDRNSPSSISQALPIEASNTK